MLNRLWIGSEVFHSARWHGQLHLMPVLFRRRAAFRGAKERSFAERKTTLIPSSSADDGGG